MVLVKRTFVSSICNVSSFRLKFRKYLTMQCANCLGYSTAKCIGESVMGEREIYIERNLFILMKRVRESILALNKGFPQRTRVFTFKVVIRCLYITIYTTHLEMLLLISILSSFYSIYPYQSFVI